MRRKTDTSYTMGIKAALRGEKQARNPFPAKINAHEDWKIGWLYFQERVKNGLLD